jgi:hypothetical protein
MQKSSPLRGFLTGILLFGLALGFVVWRVLPPDADRPPPGAPAASGPHQAPADCTPGQWRDAAAANKATLFALDWSPFGRPERGWATYAPLLAHEIGARCPADSGGFAERYAAWQASQAFTADGVVKPQEFDRLRDALALRRPFVQQTTRGICPAAGEEGQLVTARADEGYGGKVVQLRPEALNAYRRMVAAARADGVPGRMLLISGYRGPHDEAARCEDNGCNTLTQARCSAHRTGLAIDLSLEGAPGYDPVSTADENRRHMVGTVEYRWLVTNADRFGFRPYAFEPWHWEWDANASS